VKAIWIDRDSISAGENIADKIRDGIRQSFCCVFVLNSYSLNSTWCIAEVGAFWGAGKPIIIYRGIEPRCDPPDYLRAIHFAQDHHSVLEGIANERLKFETLSKQLADAVPEDPILRALRLSGLKHAFRIDVMDGEREQRVSQLVAKELACDSPSFRLVASSGFNYLHHHGKVWRAGLGNAVMSGAAKLDVVLASPFSLLAITRALANDDVIHDQWDERGIPTELRKFIGKDNVSICVTGFPVNCSLFFTVSAVFYDPYLWGHPENRRTENNFWVLEFENKNEPKYACYELLERHFAFLRGEMLGANATPVRPIPIADFLGENNGRYERLRKQFKDKIQRIRLGESYDPTVAVGD
jgi:hypothetical protein